LIKQDLCQVIPVGLQAPLGTCPIAVAYAAKRNDRSGWNGCLNAI